MLGKLIKYEFKATARVFLTVALAFLAAGIVSMVLNGTNRATGNYDGLMFGISILILVVSIWTLIGTYIGFSIKHFSDTMNGKYAYFTHTIPASTSKILFSKVFTLVYWFIFYVFIASVFFILYSRAFMDWSLRDITSVIASYDLWGPLLKALLSCIIGFTMMTTIFTFCMSLLVLPPLANRRVLKGLTFVVVWIVIVNIVSKIFNLIAYAFGYSDQALYTGYGYDGTEIFIGSIPNYVYNVELLAAAAIAAIFFVLTAYVYKNHKYIG